MKMRVDKLRARLALLDWVVPKKTTLPILKNVLVKDGKILATDLETAVSINLPEAEGECLLPYHSIMEFLKHVPGDDMITIEQDGKRIKLSLRGGAANYDAGDPKEYPPVPEIAGKVEKWLDGDLLIEALMAVLPCCAADTGRPVLCGVALHLGETIEAAGADGFRLAVQSLPLSFPVQELIIIPANTVATLAHLWKKAPGSLPMANSLVEQVTGKRQIKLILGEGNGRIKFQFGDITLVSILIAGNFPNYKQLIPNFQELGKVKFFAPELMNAVKRLKEIAKDGSGIVRLSWTDTAMTVSARSEEKGDSMTEIPVQLGANPGRIALNINYVMEYLSGKEGLVTMGTSSPSGPAVFRYGNSPVVVVMPMFVQWGDEPAEEKQPEAAVESTLVEEGPTEPEDGFQEPPEGEESGGGPGEEEEGGEEPAEAPVEVGSEQE